MPTAVRLGSAQNALFFGAKQFCQSKFELKLAAKNGLMLTHVGVFSVDFSRIDTGKTVCFLVSGGLFRAGLSNSVNYIICALNNQCKRSDSVTTATKSLLILVKNTTQMTTGVPLISTCPSVTVKSPPSWFLYTPSASATDTRPPQPDRSNTPVRSPAGDL